MAATDPLNLHFTQVALSERDRGILIEWGALSVAKDKPGGKLEELLLSLDFVKKVRRKMVF